jgi:hypothetical protein
MNDESSPLPPFDLMAEQAVLGGVLVQNETLPDAARLVQPADFFRDAHSQLFAAMLDLGGSGCAIDLVTLSHRLGIEGLERVGGKAYIAALDDGVPRATNVAHYAQIVKQYACARELIAYARRAIETFSVDPSAVGNNAGLRFAAAVHRTVDAAHPRPPAGGLPTEGLTDAADVAAKGRAIAANGVQYVVDGIVPNYGMVGISVAYTKVGKTTFGHALGAAVATGTPFLDRAVTSVRVLEVAAEDPPEYTAWLARHLSVSSGRMTFYRQPVRFDAAGLAAITTTVREGAYGLVLVSSWQSVVAGLVTDENDNAGAVAVVEQVKVAARTSGVPWLIDAHSGEGEDQSDDADPTRALRGASAAAGAADYLLSLRYAKGPVSPRRRFSGKGRFVAFEPILIEFDPATGTYTALGDGRSVISESTWQRIVEVGILHDWASVDAIAMAIGAISDSGRVTGTGRRLVQNALRQRAGVDTKTEERRSRKTTLYRLSEQQPA